MGRYKEEEDYDCNLEGGSLRGKCYKKEEDEDNERWLNDPE